MKTLLVVSMLGVLGTAFAAEPARHEVPKSKDGNLVLGLCDGQTTLEVKGVKEGESLTREQAQAASDQLMAKWREKNPQARWELAQAKTPAPAPAPAPAPQSPGSQATGTGAAAGAKQAQPPGAAANRQTGHTYGNFTERDEKIWAASTAEFIAEGNKIFHDAKLLGGTISVSCDMCHPNASNTHPETYPKYQVQLGRVALLRDMINWCIENPVRGKPLHDDDEKLRAMEAYILSERKGVPLEYGKK